MYSMSRLPTTLKYILWACSKGKIKLLWSVSRSQKVVQRMELMKIIMLIPRSILLEATYEGCASPYFMKNSYLRRDLMMSMPSFIAAGDIFFINRIL